MKSGRCRLDDMNRFTRVSEKVFERINSIDKIFKEMGKMPFNQVEATPREQREEFLKKTPKDIQNLVQQHGFAAVNEYIRKMMEG